MRAVPHLDTNGLYPEYETGKYREGTDTGKNWMVRRFHPSVHRNGDYFTYSSDSGSLYFITRILVCLRLRREKKKKPSRRD